MPATSSPSDLLPEALRPQHDRIRTIAHRGDSSSAPENTIEAFEAAIAAGSDLIEIDLRCTADGDAAVIHDASALRTTGIDAPVAALDAATLAAADAGSWFGPEFSGARVPMFGAVAEWAAGHPGVGWLVELKGRWSAAQLAGPVDAIRRHGLAERTILQGFEPETVAAAREAAPDLPRSLLVYRREHPDVLLERLRGLGAAGCNPIGRLPGQARGLAVRLRDAGYSVFPWTLDEPDEWGAAGGAGVDGVITNRPGPFRSWHASRWNAEALVP
ncbi:MAG TPA: glycerophosphodiester phosphodiesterase family protein [Pseudonocardia sp.]|nr:glycerophosphodiester phosphodiesterase family protein [Pseudonocardia sp.]